MTPPRHPDIPEPDERAALNAALLAGTSADTGFWDDHGRPAPLPNDIEEWRPSTTTKAITRQPGEQPF